VYALTELAALIERAGLRVHAVLHPGTGAPFEAKGPSTGGRALIVAKRPG
jgi:hypothetical protein